jgi:hypothetical protein
MDLTASAANTAWMAAVMLLVQMSLGLWRVNRRVLRRSHIALGIVVLPVTFVHARLSIKAVPIWFAHAIGLRLATTALLLLGVQLLLGAILIRPSKSSQPLRRVHLAVGFAIVPLAGVHVLLTW